LDHFDVVVLGEGEQTMLDLLNAHETGRDMQSVAGIAVRVGAGADTLVRDDASPFFTGKRPFAPDLDSLAFPARDLLPNRNYIDYGEKKYGHSITTIMSSRGCPFLCEFCSNVIFGGSYRERSTGSVVDEIEQALSFGYDRISFADDVFTMKPPRVFALCEEILRRKLSFKWECLGRVDAMDFSLARAMKKAGCMRIYFGIESGSERILKLMNKNITVDQARTAVEASHRAGLEVGAFFILFYPGDTDATVLQTLHFAASLPLDYLGLSMPYPLPGTGLHTRIKNNIVRQWRPGENILTDHVLLFNGDFSEIKMRIGILKGQIRFQFKKRMGNLAPLLWLFDRLTDWLLRHLK
jgi:anaerobic magnesium-protoporphyrin IX monomethyl ester cyclase